MDHAAFQIKRILLTQPNAHNLHAPAAVTGYPSPQVIPAFNTPRSIITTLTNIEHFTAI